MLWVRKHLMLLVVELEQPPLLWMGASYDPPSPEPEKPEFKEVAFLGQPSD